MKNLVLNVETRTESPKELKAVKMLA